MDPSKIYSENSIENRQARAAATPEILETWRAFSASVFKAGALDEKTKQLIAIAVAHVTQCAYCIHGHTKQALKKGATKEEIMEAVWIAAEMRAGAAYSHSALAMDDILEAESKNKNPAT